MKGLKKKSLSVALAAAMVAGTVVGCGDTGADSATNEQAQPAEKTESQTSTETTTESKDTAEASTDTAASEGGLTPFENEVTLRIAVYDRGDAGNGCSDVENNYWTKWVQENFGDKYNIKVQYVGITRSDVMTDYAMLASTNTLPTLCMEYDYDKLATWAADGYLQPIDIEQFKTIAPTYWKNMEENGLTGYTKLGDEDYMVLGKRPYGNTNYTFVTWYRKDWLKEAGLSEDYPATSTDLLAALEKMVANGHEYPLSGSKVSGAGADQNYSFRDYPQDETTWATTGDYQIPALSTEAQKRLLKWNNVLYNDGYINPEYYLRSADDVKADFTNGKAFQWSGYVSSTMDVLNSFYENNPDAELGVVVCDSKFVQDTTWGSSNAFRPNNIFGAMVAFANNATEDEVKAGEMYLEWMAQDENLFTMTWGIEGKNFNYDENGNPVAVGDQSGLEEQQGHNNNVDYWMVVTASKSFGDIEKDIKAINPQGLPQDFYEDILANYKGQLAIYEAGYANVDCLFGGALESVTEYGTSLKEEVYPEYRDKLVMCKPEEFDALYEELSQKYLEAGYQEVIDERAQMLNDGKTTRLQ
ncbi:extracellular solute-binding protein [Butyrivibrio sp. YAB3001]|uniref:extracellular solute-binding protein n=1 Tax=Butyrivibrio sp. YAB3001 TaxID=1520812 RepID=UPI0008F670F9|nr:extracellular solute-binding protein [Butyrivibrio sp. YAB3001]SFD10243.1 putative aldouronate transport system substrate-binding protein [Butyrivibrio sp. YAB3001]